MVRAQKTGCLVILLLGFRVLYAQEIGGVPIPPEFPQRIPVLYLLEFEEDFFLVAREAASQIWDDFSGSFPGEKALWDQAFEGAILAGPGVAQVLRGREGTDLFTQGVSRKIPVCIQVWISGDMDRGVMQVQYTFRGVFSEQYYFENSFEAPVPQDADLLTYFWLPLGSDLGNFIAQTVIRPPLLIQGPGGTLVYGFTPKPLVIPESGSMFVDVPIPGTYRWKMKHKQYLNQGGIFMADRDHLVLTLPQERFSLKAFFSFLDGNPKTMPKR